MPLDIILIVVAVTVCVMLIAVAILLPKLTTEKRTSERLQGINKNARRRNDPASARKQDDAALRRKDVKQTLKEIEEKNKASAKISLNQRLTQAGLTISKPVFFIFSAISAVVLGLGAFIFGAPPLVAGGAFIVGGLGLPRFFLNWKTKRRINAFTADLPDAIDVIVRGIKAGLPLNDGMRMVSAEAREPLASEFKAVVEAQQLGVPMGEAIGRLHKNIPTPETSFLATVISIQASSGGSLSEALGNLSKILRDRKKMRAKVKAVSSEAKASAGIIGSLPIVVAVVVYFFSPDYIALLFTTQAGNIVLAIAAAMMTVGIFVMRGMINFDI